LLQGSKARGREILDEVDDRSAIDHEMGFSQDSFDARV